MSEKKKKYLVLILLVLAFLFLRLSVLVFSPYPVLNDAEETYHAVVAQALLEGGYPFRLFDYQRDKYRGGHLPVILMSALSFLLFGANHLSFRTTPLIIGTGQIALLYLFLSRYFNRRVAVISSLLYILSPLPFFFRALRCFGDHWESILFILCAIFLFYKIFFDGKKRKLNFILLGIISGFATYFCYIYLLTLAWIILLWFIFDKKFFLKKGFLLFVISFLVGFSPGIYSELTYNFRAFFWLGQFLTTGGAHIAGDSFGPNFSMLSKIKTFLGPYLISALRFRNTPSLSGWNLGLIYYSIFLASFLNIVWINRKPLAKLLLGILPIRRLKISPNELPRELPLLVYMGMFSLIFVGNIGTNYISGIKPWEGFLYRHAEVYYRYLMPFYIFIFILISIFLDGLWRRRNRFLKLSSFSLLTVLISIGLIGSINSCEINFFRPINKVIPFQKDKSIFYYQLLEAVLYRLPLHETVRMADKIKPEERDDFYLSLGILLGTPSWRNNNIYIQIIKDTELKYRKYLYDGMSRVLGGRFNKNINAYIQMINRIEPEYRCYFYQGLDFGGGPNPSIQMDRIAPEYRDCLYQSLGHNLDWRFGRDIDTYIQMIDKIPPEYRDYFYQGLGFHLEWRFGRDISSYIKMADKIKPEYRKYFYQGLGLSLEWRFGRDIDTYIQMIDKIPPEYRGYFYQGLGRNTYWGLGRDINAYIQMADRIEPTYRGYFYRGWVSKDISSIFGDSPEEYIKLINRIDKRYRHFIYQGIRWGLNHQSIKQREEYFDVKDVGRPILHDLLKNLDQASPEGTNIARTVIRIGEDKRLCIFAPSDSEIKYNLDLNEGSILSFGIGVPEEFWKEENAFLAQISIRSDGKEDEIFSKYLNPGESLKYRKWFDYEIDLSGYAGKKVILSLETYPGSKSGSDDDHIPGGLCWAYPQINIISKDNF